MTHTKLVTCGCSFTEQDGWAKQVMNHFHYSGHTNLAVGAGSNSTQVNRINDFVLQNTHAFDVVWQITYPTRANLRLPPDHPDIVLKKYLPWRNKGFKYAQPSPVVNYVDLKRHVDILNTDYVYKKQPPDLVDTNNEIARMLCAMLLCKNISNNMLVFFGTDSIEPLQIEKIEEFLSKSNIAFVPHSLNLLDYVKNNQLEYSDDGVHPAKQSYIEYADNILIPAMKTQWTFN
jgi:hypothetical protein